MTMRITALVSLICLSFIGKGQLQMTPTLNDILIPMRDGEFLSADVYIPTGVTEAEVILIQTPYNKNSFQWSLPLGIGQNVDTQPFVWVIVDWRGFYGSSGADLSNFTRGEDAYDVCEWIVAQTWHKNRIGTWGPSALGKIQYDLMKENHPNHTCAVPQVAHPVFHYEDYFYGGVLEEARLETLDALGYGLSPVIMANVYYSSTWALAELQSNAPSNVKIPTLQIGGWYDHNIDKMVDWYTSTRNGADLPVRDKQWLLVGPWVHGGTGAAYVGSSVQGELNYPNAEFISDTMAWDFFNYYLLDSTNNWLSTPKITFYETGKDLWNSTNAAGIGITNSDPLYFGNNQTLSGSTSWMYSSLTSDPSNPSPTIGGATLHPNLDQGPYDQSSLETRPDILTFSTNTLDQDASISGKVNADLFISSDQPDCDIVIRLVDEYPDGRNMLITDGIKRVRFRNGYTEANEEFMTPGTIYNVTVELPNTNYTWKSGHKIKVLIGANSSIRWNVNLQDGGTMYTTGTGNVAQINLYHDQNYPSSIELPGNNAFLSTDQIAKEKIEIYPNPFTDELTISSFGANLEYALIEMSGKTVLNGNTAGMIDTETLTPGVYFLRVNQSDSFQHFKVIKR